MTIIAKFSNGHTDEYKGTRDVKAAWMVTDRQTGRVLASGHSLDRQKAEKTAQGGIRDIHFPDLGHRYHVPQSLSMMTKAYAKDLLCYLKRNGHTFEGKVTVRTVYERAKAANAELMSAKRARCEIEIVDL